MKLPINKSPCFSLYLYWRFYTNLVPTSYGACEFEVLSKEKRTRVKKDIRGNIARTYLYMSNRYGMKLSKQEQKKFNAWTKADPVSEWEKTRNDRIKEIQGNQNTFIKNATP